MDEAEFSAAEDMRFHHWDGGVPAKGPSSKAHDQDLFQIDTVSDFSVKFLGSTIGQKRESTGIIDLVDTSRKLGQIAWKALPTSAVRLFLSKYGLKVTDSAKKVVLTRIPLHKLASVVHYQEDTGENIIVIEAPLDVTTHRSNQFKYLVYQCANETDGKLISESFRQAFETMFTKATLESI